MLTDLQRRKMSRLFKVYDADGNGFIEESDLLRIAHNFAEQRGLAPGSEGYNQLRAKFLFVWEYLQKFGDPNRDYAVSLSEFLSYAQEVLEENYASIIGSTGSFLFELIDADGDGSITQDEFRLFFRAYGIEEGLVKDIFEKLDLNADSTISAEEFAKLGYDFHYSDDPLNPANWFFGPF